MTNQDHWGDLASDLGASTPAEKSSRTAPPVESDATVEAPPVAEQVDAPAVEALESSSEEVKFEIDLAEEDGVEESKDERNVATDSTTGENSGPEPDNSGEADDEPPTDFIEAVRRETERSAAVQDAGWPTPDSLASGDVAEDTADEQQTGDEWASRVPFRDTPQPPNDLAKDSPVDEAADSEAVVSDAAPAETSEGSEAEQPAGDSEEQPSRRRRRRRGRRGGRSGRSDPQDQPKADAADETTETEGAAETAIDAAETATATIDDEPSTEATTDRSKHRSVPTWPEAIRMIVDANLEARANSPNAGRGRGRGRGGRRRGRGSK